MLRRTKIKKKIKKCLNLVLDCFFPYYCLNCQKEGELVCKQCQSLLEFSPKQQKLNIDYLDQYFYLADYEQNDLMEKMLLAFKYQNLIKIVEYWQKYIEEISQKFLKKNNYDFILPIPLHKRRKLERGFNQAELIAKFIQKIIKKPFLENCLIRYKYTKQQAKLKANERQKNIKNVFKLSENCYLKARKILLVDDVLTTGSTCQAVAKILKTNGVEVVDVFSVFKG